MQTIFDGRAMHEAQRRAAFTLLDCSGPMTPISCVSSAVLLLLLFLFFLLFCFWNLF